MNCVAQNLRSLGATSINKMGEFRLSDEIGEGGRNLLRQTLKLRLGTKY